MSKVFVLDTNKQPLHPGRARILLSSGKAAVFRSYPFTIILTQEIANPHVQALRVKIDPGSKTTGIALVSGTEVIFAAELLHRGSPVKKALDRRRAIRRGRWSRQTRYRKPRFQNRARHNGWLPPSLRSIQSQAQAPLKDASLGECTQVYIVRATEDAWTPY